MGAMKGRHIVNLGVHWTFTYASLGVASILKRRAPPKISYTDIVWISKSEGKLFMAQYSVIFFNACREIIDNTAAGGQA